MLCSVFLILLFQKIFSQNLNPLVDLKTLSELPLEKLLQVQNSFKIKDFALIENDTVQAKMDKNYGTLAMALQRKKEGLNRGGHEEHYHHEEKNKVQTIFQLSITALAFLSFGGYLLCLIVQAIKSKQAAENNANNTQQQILSAFINSQAAIQANRRPNRVRNRRPNNRRPNQYVKKSKNKRPTRYKRDLTWTDISPDNMYYALVTLSEAYTNYHTTDYKHFNQTITRNGI